MDELTIEQMRDWLKRPDTRFFWGYLQAQKEDWDGRIHSFLRDEVGDATEATKANVAMDTIIDVMNLVEDQIIPDLKENNET